MNIGTSEEISIKLAELIKNYIGFKGQIKFDKIHQMVSEKF